MNSLSRRACVVIFPPWEISGGIRLIFSPGENLPVARSYAYYWIKPLMNEKLTARVVLDAVELAHARHHGQAVEGRRLPARDAVEMRRTRSRRVRPFELLDDALDLRIVFVVGGLVIHFQRFRCRLSNVLDASCFAPEDLKNGWTRRTN